MNLDESLWQKLMDGAYDRWQQHQDWSQPRMLQSCTGPERAAVILGNLNYQVGNGGFRQWVDNGYALDGPEAVSLLLTIAKETGYEQATQLATRVTELLKYVDLTLKRRGFNNYWLADDTSWDNVEEDDGPSAGEAMAESMDDWYYSIEPKLHPAVEQWLTTQMAAA